jgi:hypothetical protein
MASRTVRFEFHCDNAPEKLTYTHNIPGSLVTVDAQVAQNDPRYVSRSLGAILPIMKEHEAACRKASNPRCGNCGSPTAKVLQTPMSWLHIVENPFVCVWVNAVCGKDECEMQTRQEIQAMMAEAVRENHGQRVLGPRTSMEILPCKICGKTEATKRCAV